jgi:hypothetical protein
LVAGRIITFAEIVARENVIAGADCRLGEIASGDRLGQGARRRGDREQEIVELNSKVHARDERNKEESLEIKADLAAAVTFLEVDLRGGACSAIARLSAFAVDGMSKLTYSCVGGFGR